MEEKTKEIKRVEEWLNKIDWKLHHHGCGYYYIYDHKGNCMDWFVKFKTIEYDSPISFSMSCSFKVGDVNIKSISPTRDGRKIINHNCISFAPKGYTSCFVQFYNHDRKREKKN